ncbi:MAG: SUMF1/EgtB/PvdO family nonheme iron enzyme [Balneola sp.]
MLQKLLIYFLLISLSGCSFFKLNENKNYKPELVSVEGGSFYYGDFYEGKNTDAIPVHQVKVDEFKISKYEITYQQFDYFAEKTNLEKPESDLEKRGIRAVAYVTWDEAKAFCEFFGYRLPTETEWEYAARSGGKNQVVSGATTLDSIYVVALTKDENRSESIEVGTKQPNDLGIYDMSGNVFEWIGDYYQFYSMPERKHSLDEDAVRIIRGGSYYESMVANRTYWRTGTLRDVRSEDIGFRCADD